MSAARLFPRAVLAVALACAGFHLRGADAPVLRDSGDWRADAPGQRHRIVPRDLPPPNVNASAKNHPKIVARPDGAQLRVPSGFTVQRYADGFKNPRHLTTAPNGDIFVVESEPGLIRVLRETSGHGAPDQNVVFATGFTKPFGLAFYPPGPDPQYIYVGNTDSVVRLPYRNGDLKATGEPQKITDLPSGGQLEGGGHWTRDVVFGLEGNRLFVSVGSKTNVNQEDDPAEKERARIYSMDPDGRAKTPYATGLRNPVGLAIHPVTGELWTSVNERDGLGDDLVPDYITRVQPGAFYGWPWFYLGVGTDPRGPRRPAANGVQKITPPDVLLQAHSASLNLTFYTGDAFPKEYRHHLFAAFHGSWNREVRTGYKVIRVLVEDGQPADYYEDFLTGFVLPSGDVWGRPVGLCVTKDGALLVSEDGNNTIWRIAVAQP
jgi:glucose/arabinose dehydrogenase